MGYWSKKKCSACVVVYSIWNKEDLGADYFWKLRDEIYNGVEFETAMNGPDDDEETSPVPNQYTVFPIHGKSSFGRKLCYDKKVVVMELNSFRVNS